MPHIHTQPHHGGSAVAALATQTLNHPQTLSPTHRHRDKCVSNSLNSWCVFIDHVYVILWARANVWSVREVYCGNLTLVVLQPCSTACSECVSKLSVCFVFVQLRCVYLESLVGHFFAFSTPCDFRLWIPCGLTYEGGNAPLNTYLINGCPGELRRSCRERQRLVNKSIMYQLVEELSWW